MKTNLNGIMITGVILNIVVGYITAAAHSEDMPVLGALVAIFAVIEIIGLIVSGTSKGKTGPILVIIGCILFIPLGLVAGFGARKALDALKREEFDAANAPRPRQEEGAVAGVNKRE